ncbi:MAG TPA: hypothetical protein VGJ86_13380 [Acidimicrobiales bacterium]|jgi:hypothetical protein
MTAADATELLSLLDRFIEGPDRSRRLANEIEGIVIECFPDEPWFDDVSTALAQYVPGGGPHDYDEGALIAELRPVAETIRGSLA